MARLLVVHHSPTPVVQALTDAVVAGAGDDAIEGVELDVRPALAWARDEADAATILDAGGYVVVTPANFGYMSGALKHVFDSCFLKVGGALDDGVGGGPSTKGRPFGLVVHGRYDTEGAVRSVLSFTQALGWQQVAEPLSVLGDVDDGVSEQAYEIGGTVAALLMG